MSLISETVIIKWHPRNKMWYEDKGYLFTKIGNDFEIKVKDLPNSSNILVKVECDCCGLNLKPMPWQQYSCYVKDDGKYYCSKCARKLYGTNNINKAKLKNSVSFAQWGINNICEDFVDKYWDYNNNNELGINPWEITYSSSKTIFIKCQEKDYHDSYDVTPSHFVNMNSRCPFCSGHRIHTLDSLGKLHPEVLEIWSDKNKKSAFEYRENSNEYAYWKCENELHKDYYRSIYDANRCNYKCPHCVRERTESKLQEKARLYLEQLNYSILHEYNCSIIPQNPKTDNKRGRMPFDNEIEELKLIIEVHGEQHYRINGFHRKLAKYKNITIEESLQLQKERDKYKKTFAISQGYFYLEIPYWTDNKEEAWKKLIDDKIKEVKLIIERNN